MTVQPHFWDLSGRNPSFRRPLCNGRMAGGTEHLHLGASQLLLRLFILLLQQSCLLKVRVDECAMDMLSERCAMRPMPLDLATMTLHFL